MAPQGQGRLAEAPVSLAAGRGARASVIHDCWGAWEVDAACELTGFRCGLTSCRCAVCVFRLVLILAALDRLSSLDKEMPLAEAGVLGSKPASTSFRARASMASSVLSQERPCQAAHPDLPSYTDEYASPDLIREPCHYRAR